MTLFLWKPGLLTLAISWIICIGLGVFAWARLRPADLGLSIRGIALSIAYALAWLLLTEFALLVLAFARGLLAQRPVVVGNVGPLVDQLLAIALSEEIFSLSAVSGFVLSFTRAAAEQNKPGKEKGTNGARREGGRA